MASQATVSVKFLWGGRGEEQTLKLGSFYRVQSAGCAQPIFVTTNVNFGLLTSSAFFKHSSLIGMKADGGIILHRET